MDCSLKNSLMPSASDWSRPKGPARLGPIRFCMSATTLRSNQMVIRTVTSSRAKTNSVLAMTISTTVRSTPSAKSGSPTDTDLHVHDRRRGDVDEVRCFGGRQPYEPGRNALVGAGEERQRAAA